MERGHPVRLSAQREHSDVVLTAGSERAWPADGQDVRAPGSESPRRRDNRQLPTIDRGLFDVEMTGQVSESLGLSPFADCKSFLQVVRRNRLIVQRHSYGHSGARAVIK